MNLENLYEIYQKYPCICTDTRKILPNSLFFALKGENFDANTFALQALEKGAKYAIVDDVNLKNSPGCILSPNVLNTLQKLGSLHRSRLKIPIIGITGTNGKTTSKELIQSVLKVKYKTSATQGNLNNHIGVPLTLLSIPLDTEIAIVEMGANHIGEIGELCAIAQPNFGLITNIGKAHLEGFGSVEGIIKTKMDLYKWIASVNGTLFVNHNDKLLTKKSETIKRVFYGRDKNDFIFAELVNCNPFVKIKIDNAEIQSHLIGSYNFDNLLAAACIGKYFSLSLEEIKLGIENYIPNNNRSQFIEGKHNKIIMDAYNANPSSMNTSIESFANSPFPNKLLILGDMLELGEHSQAEHQAIINKIESLGFQNVFLVGQEFNKANSSKEIKHFSSVEHLISFIKEEKIRNFQIFIKGSRGIHLDLLKDYL